MGVQVFSYNLIKNWKASEKVSRILDVVKKGDIVMIEGKLEPEIETDLISQALANVSGRFTGIEVAFLGSLKERSFVDKIKDSIIRILIKDRMGITVVGPSKIIKEIKMNPDKLEILFK